MFLDALRISARTYKKNCNSGNFGGARGSPPYGGAKCCWPLGTAEARSCTRVSAPGPCWGVHRAQETPPLPSHQRPLLTELLAVPADEAGV